jgi:CheY-like chemotaxis protein
LQFIRSFFNLASMMLPLALVCFERLLPGSQVVNRLQDMEYRVQVVPEPALLADQAEKEKPMVAIVDLLWNRGDICGAITRLKKNPATEHIPVIAFTASSNTKLQAAGRLAGADMVSNDDAILAQLPQLLEQALEV